MTPGDYSETTIRFIRIGDIVEMVSGNYKGFQGVVEKKFPKNGPIAISVKIDFDFTEMGLTTRQHINCLLYERYWKRAVSCRVIVPNLKCYNY